jgi:O-antigen/teichoic acid export membrane protein
MSKTIQTFWMSVKNAISYLFFTPSTNLSHQTVSGGFLVFVSQFVYLVLNFLRTVILARLLAPDDFGLFGTAMLVLSILETFSQTGINVALIQNKEDIKPYLDTAWTVQVIRGIVLGLVLYFISPYISIFFEEPEILPMLRMLILVIFFRGFYNIGVVYFDKDLEFQKKILHEFLGRLVDIIVSVTIAVIFKSVWALIFGLLAGSLVRLLISYIISPFRPHFHIDGNALKKLYQYGRWVFGSAILVFLITQGDDLFVAKFLGASALGFYQMAYLISNMPSTQLTAVINQVTLPAFSKVQSDISILRQMFLKSFALTAAIAIPIAGGIFILSEELTLIFLGNQWVPIIPVMQVLAIWGALRALGGNTSPLLQAIGKPQLISGFQFVMLLSIIILIFPLTMKWGILGTAISITAGNFFIHWFRYPLIAKELHCRSAEIIKLVVFPTVATLNMILVIAVAKTLVLNISRLEILGFVILVVLGFLVYAAVNYLFSVVFHYNIYLLFNNTIRVFFKKEISTY